MVIGSTSLFQAIRPVFRLGLVLMQQRYDESKQPVKRPAGWQRGRKPNSFPGRQTTPTLPVGIKSSLKKGKFFSSRELNTAVL
jgi:hypothetical protein